MPPSFLRRRTLGHIAFAVMLSLALVNVLFPFGLSRHPGRGPFTQPLDQSAPPAASLPPATVQANFGQLPLYFIENRGQLAEQVAYYVQGKETLLYFTEDGVTFVLSDQTPRSAEPELRQPVAFPTEPAPQRWVLKLDFVDANPNVTPHGQEQTPAVFSYFTGSQEQWQTNLPTYRSLVYPNLWPGIDLVYSGTSSQLKYQFVVQPGADPHQIKLAYRGATDVTLTDAGQLQVTTPVQRFTDDTPYVYQEVNGHQVEVAAAYALEKSGDTHTYGFALGSYDPSKPLIVDPAMLVYAGYIGGNNDDYGDGIAVDAASNVYATGATRSMSGTFPTTVGPDLSYNDDGKSDAFVAKVRADGNGRTDVGAGYGISTDRPLRPNGWILSTLGILPQ